MTIKYEYYSNEGGGNGVSSATVTTETESKIKTFNPEERLKNLRQRGNKALLAKELIT